MPWWCNNFPTHNFQRSSGESKTFSSWSYSSLYRWINSPSSFFLAKEYLSCCRTNFRSPCVLAIAAILSSNYYSLFYNVYYFQWLFLENDIRTFTAIDDFQRENTVYIFQLKSFECNNAILFQFFLWKTEKFISGGEEGGPNKIGKVGDFFGKKKRRSVIRDWRVFKKQVKSPIFSIH